MNAGTLYELNGASVGSANFFVALAAGDRVEVTDVEPDGTAQKLVLRDASSSPLRARRRIRRPTPVRSPT